MKTSCTLSLVSGGDARASRPEESLPLGVRLARRHVAQGVPGGSLTHEVPW